MGTVQAATPWAGLTVARGAPLLRQADPCRHLLVLSDKLSALCRLTSRCGRVTGEAGLAIKGGGVNQKAVQRASSDLGSWRYRNREVCSGKAPPQ